MRNLKVKAKQFYASTLPECLHLRAVVWPHCGEGAVVGVLAGEQGSVLDEHGHGLQDERGKELDVDEVAGAAQPPVGKPWNSNK